MLFVGADFGVVRGCRWVGVGLINGTLIISHGDW